ncbi:MAG: hypothetical protein ACRBBP_02475 [Bdellovibrionales bacterium]
MKYLVSFGLLLYLNLSPQTALGHPSSYEGGYALMSELHPENQELSIVYSPKYWLGLGLVTMRSPDKFELATTQVGWLVNRWNLPEAQGNFYLLGGLGHGKLEAGRSSLGQEGTIYRLGAQADFETRRIYTFLRYVEHRFTDGGDLLNNQLAAAVGFAPYLGEFDKLNSWVIFKLITSNEFNDFIYLPMLRFFYKNFLWEIGQDFDGNSQFNFMVRF